MPFAFVSHGSGNSPASDDKRRYCGRSCSAKWRANRPGAKEAQSEVAKRGWAKSKIGKKSPESSLRMKLRNPMRDPVNVEKMRQSLKGRTFLSRGGNSKLTRQQVSLYEALTDFGFSAELEGPIGTKAIRGALPSLPKCYRVDVAIESLKLAIEVDGNSHKQKLWRFLDHRKEIALGLLGWSVLRFWNAEVDADIHSVVERVISSMSTTSRSPTTTTSSPTEC